jgi:hypothetical protein
MSYTTSRTGQPCCFTSVISVPIHIIKRMRIRQCSIMNISLLKRVNSNQNCCVYGCRSVRKNNSHLMYHQFPKPEEQVFIIDEFGNSKLSNRKKLWEEKLRLGNKSTKSMAVCSRHFKEDDYTCSGM